MTPVPPIVQALAFLAVLATVNELAPRFLLAVLGLVALYLVLTYSDQVAAIFQRVPTGASKLVGAKPAAGGGGGGGAIYQR